MISETSVVCLMLLYVISEAVIPAPYQVRGRLSQARNDKQGKWTFNAVRREIK
jgi:hypothetical protein